MSAGTTALRQPVWATHRRRVPGAPADLTLHVLPVAEIAPWAFTALGCLGEEETARADTVRAERARELFLVSHVVLRHVLAHRLGCRPHEVPVHHDPVTGAPRAVHGRAGAVDDAARQGAPGTPPDPAPLQPVRFSLSRTAGFVAVATAQRRVGVDVERVQSDVETDVLLDVLHPEDRTRLSRLRGRRRAVAVTRAWVRVEALVKAWETGLARDPSGIHVGPRTRAEYGRDWVVTDARTTARENTRLAVAWQADSDSLR
ncbi:4'-phosphopantetheinyl transferase superfamily protein [Kocuria rhizophila]|uniref:4'-phosphopantetheinyl transferase family protein n=1 Tax=Kocuria rhizophila TaxID=72000 RepID=UPI001D3568B6|nr:4'-phosphopantetheinyl transferase superfamily protein [Kocuria rhizophila]MCC5674032.1 4'-phosphopantetheinyl transferase superfamily protein [Kocuria rhizophila]